jgi:MGT family glycosyltransferase
VRPLFPAGAAEKAPAWIDRLPDRPTIYVTLGTVRNPLSIFRVLLAALAKVDCNVLATVGPDNDPAALEPLPENAIVERYVPQSFLLPHSSAVIAHGGSGSILAAFAEGLPTLLVPQGADQFENAAQCAALGAGLVLMPGEVNEEAVRAAVVALLEEPSYRKSAAVLAAEIAAMPHPRELVPMLAGLTT